MLWEERHPVLGAILSFVVFTVLLSGFIWLIGVEAFFVLVGIVLGLFSACFIGLALILLICLGRLAEEILNYKIGKKLWK